MQLAAVEGDGMRLVVGTDYLSWQGKNRRVAEVWRKPLTIVARADIPQQEAQ